MKKYLMFLFIASLLIFSGCSNKKDIKTINLGSMPTQSAGIYAVGIERGFFKESGVEVELDIFKSAIERDSAAVAGEVDGFMTDIMGLVNLKEKGYDFTITSYEYENFGVLIGANSDIKSKEKLQGAKIGIAENTVTEYVIDTLVKNQDVEKLNIPKIPERLATVIQGQLDGGVFPEPMISIIKEQGGKEVLTTEREEIQPVVLVFSENKIVEERESIEAFYRGYNKTIEYMKNTPYEEYKEVFVEYGIIGESMIDKFNLSVDRFKEASMPKTDDVNKVVQWMSEKNLSDRIYTFEELTTDEFIQEKGDFN